MPPAQSAKNYRNNSLRFYHLSKLPLKLNRLLANTRSQVLVRWIEDLELSLLTAKLIQPFPRRIRAAMTPSLLEKHRTPIDSLFNSQRSFQKTAENPGSKPRKELFLNLDFDGTNLNFFSLSTFIRPKYRDTGALSSSIMCVAEA